MRLTIGVLVFSLFLSKELYAQPDSLLHTSYAKRSKFVVSLCNLVTGMQAPQGAIDTLDRLAAIVAEKNDPAFATQIGFLKYNITGYLTVSNYKKELALVKKAEQKGYKYEAADGYFYLTKWLLEVDLKEEAIEMALFGYSLYRSASIIEFPQRVLYQHKVAILYFEYHKYEEAKQLLLELCGTDSHTIYITLRSFVNTLALIYREQKKYDSAIFYLQLLYNDELKLVGEEVQALAAGNIGFIYNMNKQYDSALKWMKCELGRVDSIDKKRPSTFCSYLSIADVHYKNNDLASAKDYVDTAKLIRPLVKDRKHLKYYYTTIAKLSRASGNTGEALQYMDSALIMSDSIAKHTNMSALQEVENRFIKAKNAAEILKLENARNKSLWVRNFAIAIIVFIAVITLLLINRSRLRHKAKELLLEKERNMAIAELGEFTTKLTERNRRLSELEDEIKELSNEQDISAKNDMIAKLQQSTILTDEEWDNFRILFEKVHSGYIQKVKNIYPDITPAELRYITLTKLGMNNKEMANVLGIGTNTVRNYKFRLRKKFDLTENDDLEHMIKNI